MRASGSSAAGRAAACAIHAPRLSPPCPAGPSLPCVLPPLGIVDSLTLQQRPYGAGDRKGSGQSRRFDAEKIHQAADTMVPRTADDEIGRRFLRPGNLGANARVTGLQLAVLQSRAVLADRLVKQRLARVIEAVVHPIDPGYVRAKTDLARHIHGYMHPEAPV